MMASLAVSDTDDDREFKWITFASALQPTGLFLLFYELLDSLRCLNAAWVSLSEGGRR